MLNANPVATPANHQQSLELMNDCLVAFPYREAIGSLMFLSIGTRPDITFSVSYVSRFMEKPSEIHVTAVKRIMKYLRGTSDYGILFTNSKRNDFRFHSYSDADFAMDLVNRKSTSGSVFSLGSSVISWSSELQRCTALSTMESEYIAASETSRELVWLRRLIHQLDQQILNERPILFMDNESAIKFTKNPTFHRKTKHIEVRYHFIRSQFEKGIFDVKFVGTENQLADFFTKPLPRVQFEKFRSSLNIVKAKDF